MLKKLSISYFLFLWSIYVLQAQNYQLVDINTKNFPIIEASFLASGSDYNSNSLIESDFEVQQANSILPILEVQIPKSTVIPASVVLVLDVSSSMDGKRYEALKKTAADFVNMMPTEVTEVAIATFNNFVTLNSDFTHNKKDLINTINKIKIGGGTSYDNAFLTPSSGAIHVASKGEYRRIVVFITDGLSDVKEYVVTNAANADSIIISSITIGLPVSDKLKYISNNTGGSYHSNLNTQGQLSDALKNIYAEVQWNAMGKVKWLANYSCLKDQQQKLIIKNQQFTVDYAIPYQKIGSVEVTSSNIYFKQGQKGQLQISPLFIKGNNIDLNIENISSSNPKFSVQNAVYPITSKANQYKQVNLQFVPTDSIFSSAQYIVETAGCPDIFIDASSSGKQKIQITSPKQGMEFIAGNKLPVTWKGIDKNTMVAFYYKTKNNEKIYRLGSGKLYKANFTAPVIDDSIQIIGKVTNQLTFTDILNQKVLLWNNNMFDFACYSPDYKNIITRSISGQLTSYNALTGAKNFDFENNYHDHFAFYDGFNRILSINKDAIEVYTARNGLRITSLGSHNSRVKTAFAYLNGTELYAPIINKAKIGVFNLEDYPESYVEITGSSESRFSVAYSVNNLLVKSIANKKYKFKIELLTGFVKAVLHASKPYLAVEYHDRVELYDLEKKNLITSLIEQKYLRYTSKENYLLTQNSDSIFVNNLETGNCILSAPAYGNLTFNSHVNYAVFTNSGALNAFDLKNGTVTTNPSIKEVKKLAFFPNSLKVAVLCADSLKIWNITSNSIEFETFAENGLVKHLQVSDHGNSLLITTEKVVSVWPIEEYFDSDTTDCIKIKVPNPEVVSGLNFGNHYVETSNDKSFNNTIRNNTESNILIDSVYFNSTGSFYVVYPQGEINLKPGEHVNVELNYTPHSPGEHFQTLFIQSGLSKYECAVSGIGVLNEISVMNHEINFGCRKLNTVNDTLIPVAYNSGTETIKDIALINWNKESDFYLERNTFKPLLPGDTLWVNVQFKPIKRGRQSTSLILSQNGNKQVITQLFGEGIAKRTIILAGKTINSENMQGLQSKVVLTELGSGNTVQSILTDFNGQFFISVKTDLNYSLIAELPGFFSSSLNVDLQAPQIQDTLWVKIDLFELHKNSLVKLNNIFFEFGTDKLLELSKPEIERVAKFLFQNSTLKIVIVGHTDNIGSLENNLTLSKKRALAVKQLLVQMGIEAERISIDYFGEEKPVADNSTEDGRKANRRVELKFIK